MNILLVSQCSKKAREQSCQILDQFAERKGDGTWQTAITQQGLDTLRRLLRKTARRNTAVACHWLKKNGQTELLWIVGSLRHFNAQGTVPTHRTSRDILRSQQESRWRCTEAVALLAAIAGLFHDFGKAGALFQASLTKKTAKRFQPFRHEWLSVRLFQAFVGEQSDSQWLAQLATLSVKDEKPLLARLQQDNKNVAGSPFIGLPPVAQVVAWLILSHHRLPQYLGDNPVHDYEYVDWLTAQLDAGWNARNHLDADWQERDFLRVWKFPTGTPLRSSCWQEKARQLAKRAAHAVSLAEFGALEQIFTSHLARLTLMLADHFYSSQRESNLRWQDDTYRTWANTDRESGQLKQRLDEHNIGVAHHALLLGRSLPLLREYLQAIARHKGFRERAQLLRFRWQNRAWDEVIGLRERAHRQGFFGINMASTGCGKTLANARIMYALSREEQGCRFTVALGLRTLTLQTGDALRQRLGLGEDDLAVLVGSSAIQALREDEVDAGSASADELFEAHQYVHYDGAIAQGPLRHLLDSDPRLGKMLNAPVLVATIDHLMPATEGIRGGKQIAPMLRLLTSDLVLDEPDDFDTDDQYALCRLVNWAGMLGCRVLLSSATLLPSQVLALYSAYLSGRKAFQQACSEPGTTLDVCCAWFDEHESTSASYGAQQPFLEAHRQFVARRAKRLATTPALRETKLLDIAPSGTRPPEVIGEFAEILAREMQELHDSHHQRHLSGKTVSLGLVRIANIKPLVAVARVLMQRPSPDGYCIHYCVYHSQHPLLVRSHIEQHLDAAFTRHDPESIWQQPEIRRAIETNPAIHHLFVVLATPVVEVGRDWDADWAIAEPSSVRSLIQLAGRVQRHRQQEPSSPNLSVLTKNVKSLLAGNDEHPAYCQPGFEAPDYRLNSHNLIDILHMEQYQFINAIPRIVEPQEPWRGLRRYDNLIALEHGRTHDVLLGPGTRVIPAAMWWRKPIQWSGELQRLTPFRHSQQEELYFLFMEEDDDTPCFMVQDDGVTGRKHAGNIDFVDIELADGVSLWVDCDYAGIMLDIAQRMNMELTDVSLRFGLLSLRAEKRQEIAWLYHPALGVFRALE